MSALEAKADIRWLVCPLSENAEILDICRYHPNRHSSKLGRRTPATAADYRKWAEECFTLGANRHSCSPAQDRIESRTAPCGNHRTRGPQTSKNITLSRDDLVAKLHCISVTITHNMVRQCSASCGKPSALLEALEHVVCVNRHTAALFL